MSNTGEYVTHPKSGVRHVAVMPGKTLCGVNCSKWERGEGTVSGVTSGCARCRASIRQLQRVEL